MPFHSTTIFTLTYLLPLSLAHLPQQKKHYLNMLSSKTNALLTHTLASFWRKQSCCILPLVEIQGKHDRLVEFRCGPRLCHTLTTTRCRTSHGAMHAAHCEYQGHTAARSRGSFGLAKQNFWFECDRKLVVLHQTIMKQCQHYRP